MSNPVNHNDDLFRQKMEDFREMPSDRVWSGVANALDQQKKKRRFIIWFWIGGLGFAASAIVALWLFNPIHQTEKLHTTNRGQNKVTAEQEFNATKQSPTQHDGQKINEPGNDLANMDKTSTAPSNKNTYLNITKSSSNPKADRIAKAGNHSEAHPSNQDEIVMGQNNNNQSFIENNVFQSINREPVPNIYMPTEGMQLATYPTQKYESPTIAVGCPCGPPPFRATISIYGYGGGIAYQRNSSNTFTNDPNKIFNTSNNKNKRFGVYAATAIKAGFIHRSGIYMNVGIGYEMQYFTGREQFESPGITNTPTVDGIQNSYTNTSFGWVSLPLDIEDTQNMIPQLLDGKFIYQSHHLFLPVDLGYSFQFKRFGVDLGATAAFHLPMSQKAIFYPEQGNARELKTSTPAAFNFSLGIEPSISYNITRGFSIMAGGTFRYHLLDTYKNKSSVSRPYILAGNLGLKYTFNRH